MTSSVTRRLLLILVALLALGALAWLVAPAIVDSLPGRVRQYVPQPLLALVTEPLPTALPAPERPDEAAIAALLVPVQPTQSADPAPISSPTPAPTVTPQSLSEPAETTSTPTFVATATATASSTTLPPTATPMPLPERVYLSGIDIVPQKFNNCGPANLSIVLGYHGVEHDQLEVAAIVRPTYEDRNVTPEELAAYVMQQTQLNAAVFYGGTMHQLKALLDAGLPVIVEKGLEDEDDFGWMGHYLTLYGYDEGAGYFYARDTFLGPWEEDGVESFEALLRLWHHFNNAMVVVFPSEQLETVALVLGDGYAQPATMWAAATEQARTAVRNDGQDAFAWFNLGSSLSGEARLKGDPALWRQAAAAFDQARLHGLPARMLWYQFAPYDAYLAVGRPGDVIELAEATLATQGGRSVEETFLYLGRAQRALGDEAAARASFSQAIDFSPASPAAQAAAAELATLTQ